MGIRSDKFDNIDECQRCFDPDETPNIIFVSFVDIKMGSLWDNSLPPAFNGVFPLINDAGCVWTVTIAGYQISLTFSVGTSVLTVDRPFGPEMFTSTVAAVCWQYFESSLTGPVLPFFGGRAAISWSAPAVGASFLLALDALNITPDEFTWLEFFPVSDGRNSYRVANKKTGTKAYITFDYDGL